MCYNCGIYSKPPHGRKPSGAWATRRKLATMSDFSRFIDLAQYEEWRTVPGYDGAYGISSFGRIKRLTCSAAGRKKPGDIITPKRTTNHYLAVTLFINGDGKRHLVHRLVAAAFWGPCPSDKPYVNHINGVRWDNRASNLEWVSSSENQLHSIRVLKTLVPPYGERHHSAKMTINDVLEIRRLSASGVNYHEIARRYGIAPNNARAIALRISWRSVK